MLLSTNNKTSGLRRETTFLPLLYAVEHPLNSKSNGEILIEETRQIRDYY